MHIVAESNPLESLFLEPIGYHARNGFMYSINLLCRFINCQLVPSITRLFVPRQWGNSKASLSHATEAL
jgi:hypothetical protein